MIHLYLLRHAENRANITKEFSSRKVDYPLTAKGVLQAQQTAQFFLGKEIEAIYASPLKRARQTAEIVAERLGLPVTVMENFREVDVGKLEDGPPSNEKWAFHNALIMEWMNGHPDRRFPGGEDYHELWGRMRSGLQAILASWAEGNVLVVAHGGIFSFTLLEYCPQVDRQWLFQHDNPNCSISEVLLEEKAGKLHGQLVSWAEASQLSGEAARQVSPLPDEESFKKEWSNAHRANRGEGS
jgi:broad specificity phosphatase PhoE